MSKSRMTKIAKVLELLKEDESFFDKLMRWIVLKEHDKKYKKCNAGTSEDCQGVGLASEFHGKMCSDCCLEYKRSLYARTHALPKKSTSTGKRKGKPRMLTITFAKDTKKK